MRVAGVVARNDVRNRVNKISSMLLHITPFAVQLVTNCHALQTVLNQVRTFIIIVLKYPIIVVFLNLKYLK